MMPEKTLVSWLQRFVRYPSQQTELQEKDPEVRAFVRECVAPLAREVGPVRLDRMGNLILDIGPRDAKRSIMFATYAMTHPAAGMTDPFAAALVKTKNGPAVRGRGVAEQKTALAAALGAVADAAKGELPGRLIFALLTAGETGRHDAAARVMKGLGRKPDYAIVCLGTGNKVGSSNKGRIDIEVSVRGKSAHSSMPWNGVDAIEGAQRCLEALLALDTAEDLVLGTATLTPTSIRSFPEATHTVQDLVEMTFDRRLLPGENPEAVFRAVAAALPSDGPWEVSCRCGAFMYPNEVAGDGPLMTLLDRAYVDAGLGVAETRACSFALDAGYFGRLGIESVMLGPGETGQFHSNEEHVLISDLVAMARVYRALIRRALEEDG